MKNSSGISWVYNARARKTFGKNSGTSIITDKVINEVTGYHRSFPQYALTPLHTMEALAKEYGVNKIWLKDESFRFDLNALKVLGSSYAIARYLSEKLGIKMSQVTYEKLTGRITFITATDGNHGRGVPLGSDARVVSGESGAVGAGLLSLLAKDEKLREIKDKLKLNRDARMLIISTEGATDPESYKNIVINGAYPYTDGY